MSKLEPLKSTHHSLSEISSKLSSLFNELGHDSALYFISVCVQDLTNTNNVLTQAIHGKDWNNAKKMTHKMLGASNLYSSINLQQLLRSINESTITEQNLDQQLLEVQAEINLVITKMKEKLAH